MSLVHNSTADTTGAGPYRQLLAPLCGGIAIVIYTCGPRRQPNPPYRLRTERQSVRDTYIGRRVRSPTRTV